MRKASATVICKENRIYNLSINYKGSHTRLVQYMLNDKVRPYKHNNFIDMYYSVLSILKSNGYYVDRYIEFNRVFFDIMWIDLDNPTITSKYALPIE